MPDEPFANDKRYSLTGMGPRKLVKGYYDLVDELGRRDGRKDLRDWIELKPSDTDGKAIWIEAHPTDPLSEVKTPSALKPAAAAVTDAAKPARNTPPLVVNPPKPRAPEQIDIGRVMLILVGIIVVGMLVMSAALRTKAGLPATAGAGAILVEQCPPGQMPGYLLDETTPRPLEPGPIIDDTGD